MSRHPLALDLDESTRQRLEDEARWNNQSENEFAVDAIKLQLDREAYKRRAVEEAIVEADKGIFISSEAMSRWIDSWDTDNELPPPEPDIFLEPRRK